MVNGGEQYVASLLFHELAHQKLYVKDDSEFSEAFASVIEEFGTERWLSAARYVGRARALPRSARTGRAVRRVDRRAAARLRAIYASGASATQLREDKARAFDTLRGEYEALKAGSWQGNTDYDAWFAQPLNNATAGIGRHVYELVAGAAHAAARGRVDGVLMPDRGRR